MKIAALLDHRQVLSFLSDNNLEAPAIPKGCNTIWQPIVLPDGHHAMVVNQRGFSPTAQDNEEEVNGLTLFIAVEPPTATTKTTLHDLVRQYLDSP